MQEVHHNDGVEQVDNTQERILVRRYTREKITFRSNLLLHEISIIPLSIVAIFVIVQNREGNSSILILLSIYFKICLIFFKLIYLIMMKRNITARNIRRRSSRTFTIRYFIFLTNLLMLVFYIYVVVIFFNAERNNYSIATWIGQIILI